ncbi:hypothetical protein BFP70_05115 [Thioclava sp. SK-1]|uniref:hypothetical protein n=1 Tax=Thioclava sp. SK-1 TaxID=1889770 RepID=UPI00082495A5|nr:hypothetical protein [Thioclava sp. SK-1]OCX66405.1 hypothetical protein BFP70_05115 [Thioclava sp. SK-1]
MPNPIAYLALFGWPFVTWLLFRRFSIQKAAILSVILGYLFLPTRPSIDLPILPPFNKFLIPSLSALVFAYLQTRAQHQAEQRMMRRNGERPPRSARRAPRSRVQKIVLVVMVLMLTMPVLTWATNREPMIDGIVYISGLRPYDIASLSLATLVMLVPFFVGYLYLKGRNAQLLLLRTLAWSGLVYSVLVMFESRFSPQLNVWIYGFFGNDFAQHMRQGGFRAIVFLEHGLRVGIFLCMAAMACAVLSCSADTNKGRLRWLAATAWMVLALILSKNIGAFLIAITLLPIIFLTSRKIQSLAALCIAALVLIYPLARGAGLVPVNEITSFMSQYSPERAGSLNFRLSNEDTLLERANLKPLAGWGGWGRNMLYDPETGKNTSITDGRWIIVIGSFGWIGYLGTFGLLCLPVIVLGMRARRFQLDLVDSGLLLIVAANLLDLLPNSSSMPPLWILVGALWAQYDQVQTATTKTRHNRPRAASSRESTASG